MPYAVYEVTERGSLMASEPVATITDAEMLGLGRLRWMRLQILMGEDVGAAMDKLEPAFRKVSEDKLDRRLREIATEHNALLEGSK